MFKILEAKSIKYATEEKVEAINKIARRLNEITKEVKFSSKTKEALKDLELAAAGVFKNKSWTKTKKNVIIESIRKESTHNKILASLLEDYFEKLLDLKKKKFLWWIF